MGRRAKSRIARQRIEVGLPLGKIVNARKEVFAELKVCHSSEVDYKLTKGDLQQPRLTVRGRQTTFHRPLLSQLPTRPHNILDGRCETVGSTQPQCGRGEERAFG